MNELKKKTPAEIEAERRLAEKVTKDHQTILPDVSHHYADREPLKDKPVSIAADALNVSARS